MEAEAKSRRRRKIFSLFTFQIFFFQMFIELIEDNAEQILD
jgi:hypothetical protein